MSIYRMSSTEEYFVNGNERYRRCLSRRTSEYFFSFSSLDWMDFRRRTRSTEMVGDGFTLATFG
jgi:hypothetical protein